MPREKSQNGPGLEFAARVRKLRSGTYLTRAKFAEALGVSVGSLQHWEDGYRSPDAAALALIKLIEFNPPVMLSVLSDSRINDPKWRAERKQK